MNKFMALTKNMEPAQMTEFQSFVMKTNIQFEENNNYDPLMIKFV